MTRYKLRAECTRDIEEMAKVVEMTDVQATSLKDYADVDLDFSCELPLAEIRRRLLTVEDGHVMLETVARAEDYTGERVPYVPND